MYPHLLKSCIQKAAAPVYDWFKSNVDGGEEVFNAFTAAVNKAEADVGGGRSKDIN